MQMNKHGKKESISSVPHEHAELDRQTIEQLQQSLAQLERLYPVYTPDLQWFEAKLAEGRRKQRKKLLRDLAFLWGSAAMLLSVSYLMLNRLPAAFVAVQAAASIAPLPLLVWKKKEAGPQ
jgi:hypothetical protein